MTKKRFTDADIWRKKWFRKLPLKGKALWFYLKDNCSNAGLIEFDDEIISMYLGENVTLEYTLEIFKDKVLIIGNDKLFLVDFISFQYGELSEKCNPHKPILKEITKLNKKYGINFNNGLRVPERVPVTLEEKEKEKEQEQDKEQDKEKGDNFKKLTPHDIMQLWNEMMPPTFEYCRGLGSGGHIVNLKKTFTEIKTMDEWRELFSMVKESDQLSAKTEIKFLASLTWVIQQDNAVKIRNGDYKNKGKSVSESIMDSLRELEDE